MYFSTCFVFVFSGNSSDVLLLRGAVFFIGMCLWGSQRVTTLKHSHSTVLPSMLQVSVCFVVTAINSCFSLNVSYYCFLCTVILLHASCHVFTLFIMLSLFEYDWNVSVASSVRLYTVTLSSFK